MSNNVIQTSFAGGELSPTLYARVDLAKYHIGAARLLNFFVDYRGGASNRPGFELVAQTARNTDIVRLIPFQFSIFQNYVLEFGDQYMRVVKDGAIVLNTPKTINSISQANPGVVNVTAHGYPDGTRVVFTVAGMTQLNVLTYTTVSTGVDTFTLIDPYGTPVNTSAYGAFVSGTVASIYTIASPYADEDLAMLKFTQSADVMTFTHPDYPPYDLSRTGDTAWTFTQVVFGSTQINVGGAPTAIVNPATVGVTQYSYVVTAINAAGEESVASTKANASAAINIANTAGSVTIQWAAAAGAVAYNVYKALPVDNASISAGALYGYMTTVTTTSAVDSNIVPDFTVSPPINNNPFAGNNHPIAVTYDQQRKVYAGSNAQPETFWMSKPGQFTNFDVSNPIQPSDSIEATLVSRQVNNIKYMISMPGGLIMLTGAGAWQVSGGSAGAVLTPTTINASPQAYNGCADVEPITVNYDILYVQQKGTVIRDLSYSFYTNIYTGADISVLSNHLFTGYFVREWTYAEEPFKIVWAVRSDGVLLSLTYLKEQEIFGWARHNTEGRFLSITSIQEGQENVVYVVVERMIGGVPLQFIERMHTRQMTYGSEDAFFVDCGLSTAPTYPEYDITISAPTGTDIPVYAEPQLFDVSMVGKVIRAGKGIMTVTDFVNAGEIRVDITTDIEDLVPYLEPPTVWTQAAGNWSLWTNISTVTGLDHLNGCTVSILGDGNVFPQQVVNNGTILLSQECSKIHIGLPYTAQLQTLYLDTGDPTIQGKRKNISAMTMRVDQTRGLAAGPTFDDLTSYKDRHLHDIGKPIPLFTGDQRLLIGGGWQTEGQVAIEQSNPLPATILGVIPEIQLGDTGK